MSISGKSKKNLIIVVILIFAVLLLLAFRVGWIQIVKGEEYSARAVQQQTKDQTLKAERGVIFDANGEELAVSITCYSIWVRPDNVKTGDTGEEIRKNLTTTADVLAANTDVPKGKINRILNSGEKLVCVARGLDKDAADRAEAQMKEYLEQRREEHRDYAPDAYKLLTDAKVERKGLLLAVISGKNAAAELSALLSGE